MSNLEQRVNALRFQLSVTSDPVAKIIVRGRLHNATEQLRRVMLAGLEAELSR